MQAKDTLTNLQQILMSEIAQTYGPELKAVFLTGSRARGATHAFSDINLLVVTEQSSEQSHLFSQGNLVSLQVKPLADLLAELYSPEGQQVTEWWLLAGSLQQAVPWLDRDGVLAAARLIINERRPLIDLHNRILWDDQLAVLAHWLAELEQAAPFQREYLSAVMHVLRRAETALLIYHGQIVPEHDLSLLPRPKSFLADWASLCCLGAEPKRVDTIQCCNALAQVVRMIWTAGQQSLADSWSRKEFASRQQLLDRVPGVQTDRYQLPAALPVLPELMDRALAIVWAAARHSSQRESAKLLLEADLLWSLLEAADLLMIDEVRELLELARIPQTANSTQALAAAKRLQQGLETLGRLPAIVPQSRKQRIRSIK